MTARRRFEEEMQALGVELEKMCSLTERMIEDATVALLNGDASLGAGLRETDKRVNEYEMHIEKICMRLLLRQQPVATDFRRISATLKVITDIERFGDQASDIGELVATLSEKPPLFEQTHLEAMGELAIRMVHDSVGAFVQGDETLAGTVIALDDWMDDLFQTVKAELIEGIRLSSACADTALTLLMIAKYYERIGDHAVNVAEWTKFRGSGIHAKY